MPDVTRDCCCALMSFASCSLPTNSCRQMLDSGKRLVGDNPNRCGPPRNIGQVALLAGGSVDGAPRMAVSWAPVSAPENADRHGSAAR